MPLYDELRRIIGSAYMSREREGHTDAFPPQCGSRHAVNRDSLRSQPQCGEARFRRGTRSLDESFPSVWMRGRLMKHLGGLGTEEIAGAMGISVATVGRELRLGAAYLRVVMSPVT